ncbi:MAG: hypothetical protein CL454_00595 [Acidimicrobiaceae bacterium]|nr:hypothetical protein [Acidimicrobiaceae bacterium]
MNGDKKKKPHSKALKCMGCSLSVRVGPEQLAAHAAGTRAGPHRTSVDVGTSPMRTPFSLRMRGRGRKSLSQASPSTPSSTMYALVIGVDQYGHWENLDCAVRDATCIATWLRAHGFIVVTLKGAEATFANVARAFMAIPDCKTAVVSLHGHGAQGKTVSSFVPADACADPNDTSDKISADFIQSWSMRWNGKQALIVADCCFGGNFVLPPQVKMRGYRDSQKERVRMILSASTMDELVPDRQQGEHNSPLTRSMLRVLGNKRWNGSVLDLFVSIRKMTPEGCTPKMARLSGDQGGDIWLR